MNKYYEVLKQLGLNNTEISIYLASLETGPAPVIALAKASGMKRSSIYNFLNDLMRIGIIVASPKGNKFVYSAVAPEGLMALAEKQKESLSAIIPELTMLMGKSGSERPKIRFYEGVEGLKTVYWDTLEQSEDSEILAYATFEDIYRVFPEAFRQQYLKKRIKRKMITKAIARSGEYALSHAKNDKKEYRETIVLPVADFPVTNEINIYGDKVAIISFGENKLGIIIESKEIAGTQRAIFNLLWKSLKQLKK